MIIAITVAISVSSCYDDYIKDYDYSSVYFPYQTDVRTVVVGEGLKIAIGVDLGGVTSNKSDRTVYFERVDSLINPSVLTTMQTGLDYIKNAVTSVTTLKPLPKNYYTLSDTSKFIIKAGETCGTITLNVDSNLFLNDPATLNAAYAVPLYIIQGDADSVVNAKRYAVIGLKYENMLFGNYWHGGVTTVTDANGNVINTIKYYTTIPSPESKIWTLTTVGPNSLVTNGYSDQTTKKKEMLLTLQGDNIVIATNAGSTYAIQADGESTFNRAKLLQNRKIYLNYKYVNAAGNTCYAKDTLTFRNRVRDGVNEWQDENPSNY